MWLRVGGVLTLEISKQRNDFISESRFQIMYDSLTIPGEDSTFLQNFGQHQSSKGVHISIFCLLTASISHLEAVSVVLVRKKCMRFVV